MKHLKSITESSGMEDLISDLEDLVFDGVEIKIGRVGGSSSNIRVNFSYNEGGLRKWKVETTSDDMRETIKEALHVLHKMKSGEKDHRYKKYDPLDQ